MRAAVIVLLALWPFALACSRRPSPLGLGQVLERVEASIAEWLADTPFLQWLPVREVELQPLVPGVELLCVALGTLVPCLLGYLVARSAVQRAVLLPLILLGGVAASALSAALSYGPDHAWAWFDLPVQVGLAAALFAGVLLLFAPRRLCAALLLVGLVLQLSLLNQAPESAYFAQTLAYLGAGALHPLPRPGAMAGMGVALRGAGLCGGRPVAPGAAGWRRGGLTMAWRWHRAAQQPQKRPGH
jgi:hypothetical protein